MEIIYSGKEVKRLLNENIPGYKPVIGGNASTENEKINKKSNKESIKKTKLVKIKDEFKPKKSENQSTDLGNNKNMLDLQFDADPGKEFKDRVKKQVTGEDSIFGNKPDGDSTNKVNKAFYNAAKDATKNTTKKRQDLENSGLNGKNIPVDKKNTSFNENVKTKRLNFKNTQFLSEKHMFSLIPEDYKKDGIKFMMKDRCGNEYLIEWKLDKETNLSEGVILLHENKQKVKNEFDRIKKLYEYKSKEQMGNLTNKDRQLEESKISIGIKKLKEISDN